jgi:mycothiol synthase
VAEVPGQGLVGYADLSPQAERTRFWIDLRVPPGASAAESTDALLAELETRAACGAAPGAWIQASIPSVDDCAANGLHARRYQPFRHSFRMEIDLGAGFEPPHWPEGIVVRSAVPGRDEKAVYEVHEETFSDQFEHSALSFDEWRAHSLLGSHEPSLWFLAEDGGELAGISLCRLDWEGDADLGWVSVLGVRRPWRRRGLGLALLLHSFAELQSHGKRRVGLGVDGLSSTGAVQLYERGGMHVARRYDHFRKALCV